MSTPSATGQGPSIVQQVKDDMVRSEAAAKARVSAFEQKQTGWLRANARVLVIGAAILAGLVLLAYLAHKA